jgi:methionyl-tRNA formyltransferase
MSHAPLRIVVLTTFLPNYQMISSWAARNDAEIALVVTPNLTPDARYGGSRHSLAQGLDDKSPLLVTSKLRSVAVPVIGSLMPDVLVSAAFPRLIPQELLALPKYGAVNMHPSVLPAGRGPNPARLVYEGAETIGATLHRTEADFDTGAVLSVRERPVPAELSGRTLLAGWIELLAEVFEEGIARVVDGDPGVRQNDAASSYAGRFTEAEIRLDLTEPAAVLRRKAAALNFVATQALVSIGGQEHLVEQIYPVTGSADTGAAAGTVLGTYVDGWTVKTADEVVRIIKA